MRMESRHVYRTEEREREREGEREGERERERERSHKGSHTQRTRERGERACCNIIEASLRVHARQPASGEGQQIAEALREAGQPERGAGVRDGAVVCAE